MYSVMIFGRNLHTKIDLLMVPYMSSHVCPQHFLLIPYYGQSGSLYSLTDSGYAAGYHMMVSLSTNIKVLAMDEYTCEYEFATERNWKTDRRLHNQSTQN